MTFSEVSQDSNGCLLKLNTTITTLDIDGRIRDKSVESLDECSSACKDEPPCEAFLYQEEGRNCTLFSGTEAPVEQSGNGTVGYCLPGKFLVEFWPKLSTSCIFNRGASEELPPQAEVQNGSRQQLEVVCKHNEPVRKGLLHGRDVQWILFRSALGRLREV